MPQSLNDLFLKNKEWSDQIKAEDPEFFNKLAKQQAPEYLWIGCSDSRVPANEIVGLLPGELFVHRNVANVVFHTDFNCLSVLQYAIDVLKVKHIIICGHYGCGGVKAAMGCESHGLIDNWLSGIKHLFQENQELVDKLGSGSEQLDFMCELNVVQQVSNLGQTTVVQDAWSRGQELHLHGFIYGISDGILRNLNVSVDSPAQMSGIKAENWACERYGL
ncbi:MAG: carbonate dehydratase [Gammaproteobacteria bacterium]|nr:carbonate dehydratase [Gammaproteobacteria bacterium]